MKFTFAESLSPEIRTSVVPVAEDSLPAFLPNALKEGAKENRFKGKPGQIFEGFAEIDGAVRQIVLAGTGKAGAADRQAALEKAGAAVIARYLTSGKKSVGVDFSEANVDAAGAAAFLMGMRLRSWRIDTYRTKLKEEQKPSLTEAVVIGAPAGTDAAWDDAAAVATGVEFTRELVSEPANKIYPETFVERCKERLEGTGIEITVLTVEEMSALGMGALLGVGQGSIDRPARIIAMHWKGGGSEAPLAFVGKGVTFDSGGISIKPAAGMEEMKWDMGGAGAVAGTMLALAARKAKANIVGICGLTENMPDGNAQRPGDVVTSMSGQTIEVINTDAEGRLVLCDALHWCQETFKPSKIVDLATLTGAILVSLGKEHAGLFSNNDELSDALTAAGKSVGEKLWRMPLAPEYDRLMDSQIADMKNAGPRFGGSITAAQFLQRFIMNDTPWAHLDVAGMVWADKPGATWDKGATGYGVRLLDRLVRDTLNG
ncbi:leucyl aminopeptidase [Croceicoccus mobilis]|uniref:Probable cytosol aminopeptidase n=1 Tax=Croceicoccus mobilis TaxID=1703339 RepID=A0A916Z5U7_9SPHN|nr:leucyl aminopeptidase [Croceicoccus mobilis]GGD78201.1 putative cytosol aminopeptidase [Croceicoccus mobilis]